MPKKSGEDLDWILETKAPFASFEDPMLDSVYRADVELFEAQGSAGLEEKYPNQAKKLGTLTPEKLYTDESHRRALKARQIAPADDEGTMTIPGDNEYAAIHLYKAFSAVRAGVKFSKFGKDMPTALKRELEQTKKEQNDIQRVIMRGGLGSR